MRHTTYVIASERPHVPSEWVVNGLRIRLTQGRKGPEDTLIAIATPGGQPLVLSLASLGAVISLWYRNEDRLYPNGSGGRLPLAFLDMCCQPGGISKACLQYNVPLKVERVEL